MPYLIRAPRLDSECGPRDYLASDFVGNGWSVKKLEREILLSSVYRQSSDDRADVTKAAPENRLWFRSRIAQSPLR